MEGRRVTFSLEHWPEGPEVESQRVASQQAEWGRAVPRRAGLWRVQGLQAESRRVASQPAES
jgi:hypothetical protein